MQIDHIAQFYFARLLERMFLQLEYSEAVDQFEYYVRLAENKLRPAELSKVLG